jgi:F-type H+-transporting ATPase subunit delta
MREPATLARPYANAVFRMAHEAGALSEWSERLALLAAIVADPSLQTLIADPRLPRATLADLVVDVGGSAFDEASCNLVRVLTDNQKLALAPVIWQMFEEERARARRRETVKVRSAYPLEPSMQAAIARAMRTRLGCEVDLETEVDPALIGGVVIRAGDRVLDASVKGRLGQLARALA